MSTKPFTKLVVGDRFRLMYFSDQSVHVVEVVNAPRPYFNGAQRVARALVRSDDGTAFSAFGWYSDDDLRELVDDDDDEDAGVNYVIDRNEAKAAAAGCWNCGNTDPPQYGGTDSAGNTITSCGQCGERQEEE